MRTKKDNKIIRVWRESPLAIFAIPASIFVYASYRIVASNSSGETNNTAVWSIGILLTILLLAVVGVAPLFMKEEYQRSGISFVDDMSGVEFEDRLESLYGHMGYSVDTTPTSGDYGADLILKKGQEKIILQAKRYSNNVGLTAVQEAVGAIALYGATSAIVVTNSFFTKAAKNLAKANNVRLVERPELTVMLATQAGETPARSGLMLLLAQTYSGVRPVAFVTTNIIKVTLLALWGTLRFITHLFKNRG